MFLKQLYSLYNGSSREVKAVAISDRRWCYGVKPLKPINPNERSSLSVRCGRFTINAGFRYVYRSLNRINC
nr:hypothetical protein [Companilactobacillus alimentarius]